MPRVTIQGVGDVNFPDTMTPEQITQAIEQDILPKAQKQPQPQAIAPQERPAPMQKMDSLEPTWAERNIAPLLEKVVGSNPQGSIPGRMIQGAADAPIGVMQTAANLLPKSTGIPQAVNSRVTNLEDQYQAQRREAGSTGFDPGRLAGNILGTAPLLPAGGASGPMWAQILRGGATGAAFGAAQPVTDAREKGLSDLVTRAEPVDFWKEKGKQAALGGVFGAATTPIAAALARVVQPQTGEAARKLIDEGVTLTPGQTLGGGFKRAEDAATSIPVVGDFIRDAKNRTLADFNRAAYARALRGTTEKADDLPVGPEGVAAVKGALKKAYDDLLPKMSFTADAPFVQGMNSLRQLAADLPEREAKQFESILTKNLQQLGPQGKMDGEAFKLVESSLGSDAKGFLGATDGYQKKLGEALMEAQNLFRQGLQRSNPQYAEELAKINEGYANYARIRAAAASAGDKSNGFTPAQLAAAVRAGDKSAGKGATASGQALMQDLSDAGRAVLPSSVADSGTPLRHIAQLAVPGGAAALMSPQVGAGVGAAAGAGALMTLPYTAPGQKLAQILLAQRPKGAAELADLLRRGGPLLGAASAPALLQ